MKSTFIFALSVLLVFSALTATAQSTFKLDSKTTTFIDNAMMECIYKYTVNAPLKDSIDKRQSKIYSTILQASASASKFWDWHSFKKDSLIYASPDQLSADSINKLEWKYSMKVKDLFVPVILKNFPGGKITVTDEIVPDDYTYNENKTERNWILKDDTLTVCGYLCNKAVTPLGGREWTAWYAPDITLSEGPWKLYGLPGLILKAEDSTGTHSFEAIAIRQSERPIYLAKNALQLKIGKGQFIKNKNKFEENPQKNLFAGSIQSVSVLKKEQVMIINGKRCSMDSKTIYCPLELE